MQKSENELFEELIKLDQQYPGRLVLKVKLGALMLKSGEREQAAVYLHKGEKLAGGSSDRKLKAMLYENLAQLALLEKNYNDVIAYADKAIAEGGQGGISFLKGRALYFQGKKDQALEVMDAGRSKIDDRVTRDELELYLDLLIDKARNEDALGILDEYLKRYGYSTGISNTGSILTEKAGKKSESVLWAFMDLEYGREYGKLDMTKTIAMLGELEKIPGLERLLIDGLKRYVKKEWNAAKDIFDKIESTHHFYQYVKLITEIEAGSIDRSKMEYFIKLEIYYRTFPAYYYYVWRGLKTTGVNYSILEVRKIIEKAIILAKGTEYENTSRVELGRLLGLNAINSEKLLIGPEMDDIYEQVLKTGNMRGLDKIAKVLSLPENVYSMAAGFGLKDVVKTSEEARKYIEKLEQEANGILKERLSKILKEASFEK